MVSVRQKGKKGGMWRRLEKITFKGKNMGNHDIISAERDSIVEGFVDKPTPGYRSASKYPAKP